MSESTLERENSPEAGDTEVNVGATGRELREHREAMGASLSDVSDMLRIRHDFLEALESGHYDALPGEAYAVGFVRSYAKYLGLDADAMARRFKVELSGERPTARLDFLAPAAESRVPTAAIVFVAVLLAIAIYGLWYFLNARDFSVGDIVPEIPARLAGTAAPTAPPAEPASGTTVSTTTVPGATVSEAPAATEAGAAKQGGDSTPSAAAGTPPAGAEALAGQNPQSDITPQNPETPNTVPTSVDAKPPAKPAVPESPALSDGAMAQPQAAGSQAEAVAEAATSKPPVPAPVPPARPSAVPDQRVASVAPQPVPSASASSQPAGGTPTLPRIVLRATADSWVEVRTESGDLVISRVLTQGTSYSVPPRPGLKLTTGNAGGLEILVDGVALPPLGRSGRVRRDIALDPDKLKSRAAAGTR